MELALRSLTVLLQKNNEDLLFKIKWTKKHRKMVRQKLFLPEHILNKIDSYLKPDVLIAQIQTCCEGLNLQHFAEVYFTTPHWNPAVEDQAVARAHRIGQKDEVDVFRFMTTFKEPTKNDTIRHSLEI